MWRSGGLSPALWVSSSRCWAGEKLLFDAEIPLEFFPEISNKATLLLADTTGYKLSKQFETLGPQAMASLGNGGFCNTNQFPQLRHDGLSMSIKRVAPDQNPSSKCNY